MLSWQVAHKLSHGPVITAQHTTHVLLTSAVAAGATDVAGAITGAAETRNKEAGVRAAFFWMFVSPLVGTERLRAQDSAWSQSGAWDGSW